jgi:hypothetical protein
VVPTIRTSPRGDAAITSEALMSAIVVRNLRDQDPAEVQMKRLTATDS